MLPVAYGPRLVEATARMPAVAVVRACTAFGAGTFLLLMPLRLAEVVPVTALAVPFAFFHAGALLAMAALAGRQRGAASLLLANLAPVGVFWLTVLSLQGLTAIA